jgi:hypothetical protein
MKLPCITGTPDLSRFVVAQVASGRGQLAKELSRPGQCLLHVRRAPRPPGGLWCPAGNTAPDPSGHERRAKPAQEG